MPDERRKSPARTPPAPTEAGTARGTSRDLATPAQRGGGPGWIYGTHAVLAVLANPARRIARIVAVSETLPDIAPRITAQEAVRGARLPPVEALSRDELDQLLPRGSVHQGVAVQAADLEALDIDDLIRLIGDRPRVRLVALDQVTDPHNVGAILRSAAAFGVDAVILPERHAPAASAVMAKTASGALDKVPLVRVVNLARAMDSLKAANVWCIGLAGTAQQTIRDADLSGRVALVLGSEGDGLRRLTRERCDLLVRIPMHGGGVESLNVSNAAAIALYEAFRGGASGG
jgi:23S rRNA (guanosine2251-2'-O)-methyltransferase